jgi:hypothetical protein
VAKEVTIIHLIVFLCTLTEGNHKTKNFFAFFICVVWFALLGGGGGHAKATTLKKQPRTHCVFAPVDRFLGCLFFKDTLPFDSN